jgi:glycerol-3-phosphate acyltransferase PlsY
VREVGSGNVGATNVLRTAGKAAGLMAFGLDTAKGAAATVLALRLGQGPELAAAAAAAAVIGHMYPVWLGFRGGKGVATGAGAFAPLAPLSTAIGLASFALVAGVTRYVSLGSLAGTATLAASTFVLGSPPAQCWSATLTGALIVLKHRSNLERIFRGDESRLGSQRP